MQSLVSRSFFPSTSSRPIPQFNIQRLHFSHYAAVASLADEDIIIYKANRSECCVAVHLSFTVCVCRYDCVFVYICACALKQNTVLWSYHHLHQLPVFMCICIYNEWGIYICIYIHTYAQVGNKHKYGYECYVIAISSPWSCPFSYIFMVWQKQIYYNFSIQLIINKYKSSNRDFSTTRSSEPSRNWYFNNSSRFSAYSRNTSTHGMQLGLTMGT